MEVYVGTDIVAISRVRALIDGGASRFLTRWFTTQEIDYCRSKAHPERHFAARLAAKEAVFKALDIDSGSSVPWSHISILAIPGRAPEVQLTGDIEEHASRRGTYVIRVSLSHCVDYATATAVITCGS